MGPTPVILLALEGEENILPLQSELFTNLLWLIILLFHFNGILGALGKALAAAYAFIVQHLMLTL